MNLAKLLEGPAVVFHRGQYFESRGGSVLTPEATSFSVETDRYGSLDKRYDDISIKLQLTPIGVWSSAVLGVLHRWTNPTIGQLVTPIYDISTIDLATNFITLLGTDGPRIGCPVRCTSFGTLPAPLVDGTLYYAGVPNPTNPYVITLHATSADALAGTNIIDITTAGTSDHRIIEQEPLTIWTTTNRRIDFWNAAVVEMPRTVFSARNTLIGPVGFECFRINNSDWSVANSLYTVSKSVLSVTPPAATDIPTQAYTFAWGSAPWDSFTMREDFTLTPSLGLSPVTDGARGTLSRKIQSLSVTGQGIPDGFSEQQLLDILGIQGGSA